MSKLIIKMRPIVLLYIALSSYITTSAAAHQASPANNVQKKQIQHAVGYAERLLTQTAVPLKYNMVGYLESWGTVSIEEAIANNYNVIVIAFGTIDGDQVGMNLYQTLKIVLLSLIVKG